MKPRDRTRARAWLLLLAPPFIWFAQFSALYGLVAFANLEAPKFQIAAWLVTGGACLAIAAAWASARRTRARSGEDRTIAGMAGWLAFLSLAAILFQTLTFTLLPS